MAFLEFKSVHDPSGQLSGPWTFLMLLDAADSLTTATVTVVDGSDVPIGGTDLIVSAISIAYVGSQSSVPTNIWGVSFYLQNGSGPKFYNLRCRYTTTHSPQVGGDITMRVLVKNT